MTYYKLQMDYKYKGKIFNIVDADTFDAIIDVGFGITVTQRFRVDSFDAPETFRPRNEAEKIHGTAAKNRATELLLNKKLIFITTKIPEIYGRYGAQIYMEDGRDFAQVMIEEGFQKHVNY